MEIAILLLLLLVVLMFTLPVIAIVKAHAASRRLDELSARMVPLEEAVAGLRRELDRRRRGPAPAESAPVREHPAPDADDRIAVAKRESETVAPPGGAARTPATHVPVDRPPPLPQTVSLPSGPSVSRPAESRTNAGVGAASSPDRFNWEQFMGVRLFAWLGGLALFLAAAFFVKFSFDHGLIPPAVRVTLGFMTGFGLLLGGLRLSQQRYKITADTLSATGVVILYAVTFACRSVYHFPAFQSSTTFLLMTGITGAAFLIAVRMNAMVVAVLGLLGGFLTPFLVGAGEDNPFGLFSYIALLDAGLIGVAIRRRWDWLTTAAATGTAIVQLFWVLAFFSEERALTAMAVFLGFCGLFLTANLWSRRRGDANLWLDVATLIPPAATFLFVPVLISDTVIGERPVILHSFLLGADLTVMVLAFTRLQHRALHFISGGVVFVLLALWTTTRVDDALLLWALGGYLAFTVLHTLIPIVQHRVGATASIGNRVQVFPLVALATTVIPMLKLDASGDAVWLFVLLIDLMAVALAVMVASIGAVLLSLLVTVALAFTWILVAPFNLFGALVVLGGLAIVFTLAGMLGGRIILQRQRVLGAAADVPLLPAGWSPEYLQRQIPAFSAILPFLLLIMVVARVDLPSAAPVFGFALGLGVLLLGLERGYRLDWLPAVGLVCTFLLECAWHLKHVAVASPWTALGWYSVFYVVYLVFPFVCHRRDASRVVAWGTAALSGPVQFLLVYSLIGRAWPNDSMGLVPALFAVPTLAGLSWLIARIPRDDARRNTVLAWFGGVSLLFITLIFPIQLERQWLTIAWALEGAALLWLFGRVPHQGLRYTGFGLLTLAFVRLSLNVAVLDYSPRSELPILNWYLYTYGLVIAALFAGARWMREPNDRLFGWNARTVLVTFGTTLAFILLNVEIADFFSEPGRPKLTFQFGGNFARDMAYTIGWALFAFALMLVGILKRVPAGRWAAIGLLGVTLLKLFFHDLAALNQLYRVGALVGVAVVAIVVSFLYQRFLRDSAETNASGPSGDAR